MSAKEVRLNSQYSSLVSTARTNPVGETGLEEANGGHAEREGPPANLKLAKKGIEKLVLRVGWECSLDCTLHGYVEPTDKNHKIRESSYQQHPGFPSIETQAARLFGRINDWQTRILELRPGLFGEPLKARLNVADLVHGSYAILHEAQVKVEYEALSYFWGDPVFVRTIECNGICYPISSNLHQALQRLRRPSQARYLWIDALCINQHNVAERSTQVSNMLLIYQKAKKIIVWLGEQQQHTESVARCFTSEAPTVCGSHGSNVYHGVRDLLSRPWFRRVWVKQEVWAANEIDVACGESVFPWDVFESRASRLLEEIDSRKPTKTSRRGFENLFPGLQRASRVQRALISLLGQEAEEIHSLMRFSTERRQNLVNDESELLKVLIRTSRAECSDLRDHVYAILGMTGVSHGSAAHSGDVGTLKFVVDYERSIAEVYQDVVRYYVDRDHSLWIFNALLDFFFQCRGLRFGGVVENEMLPSWCPNWSIPLKLESPERASQVADAGPVWGGHGSICELRSTYPSSLISTTRPRENVLNLSGLVLPEIESFEHYRGFHRLYVEGEQMQMCHRVVTGKYTQGSTLSRRKQGPDERHGLLKDQWKALNSLGEGARHWRIRGRAPLYDSILVAVEGSLAPFVLRSHSDGRTFEFRGIVVPFEEGEIRSKTFSALQDLVVAAKEFGLTDLFQVT